jgi:NitT/TauT family transport system ATP-binding protein
MAEPLLSLHGVGKTYPNGTLALDGLTLGIGRHEFVSLLGPSGCGKSTALKMIAALVPHTHGEIRWADGVDHGADMGFVFQEPTLMPWATVFDNVWLPLRLKGQSRASCTERVMALLDTVGLSAFANVYPRELSGGMKMRVSIARALVTKPKLLLMDEPFAALDEMTRFKLNQDLLALWEREQFTVVFVTHSVFESVYLSQRVVVMAARPGRVLAEVSVAEPYPRSEAFRTTSAYNADCIAVSQHLTHSVA